MRSEKTVIAVDQIKTVLSYSHVDISFQEISEKSVEPVLMVVKGLTANFGQIWILEKQVPGLLET